MATILLYNIQAIFIGILEISILQEKQAGNYFTITDEGIIDTADKLI